MANLFTIFTPFQLFVAQQVINQEKLTDNILLEGYIEGNPHFLKIYDLMCIDDMWQKKIVFPELPRWDGNRTTSFTDIIHSYKNYKFICEIVEANKVDTFFLSEIQNTSQRFLNVLFANKGLKINYFEEGGGHYVQRPYRKETLALKIKEWVRDLIYYLPIYNVRFAKWRYVPSRPINGDLPINKRYSILPVFSEPFDVRLYIKNMISNQLKDYMDSNVIPNDAQRVLLMTDPMADLIGTENLEYYYDTIQETLYNVDKSFKVYIKFHPRDNDNDKRKICEIAEMLNLNYSVISNGINIPIEYYLQDYLFDRVYIFNSVTYFYNGYVYPKQKFVKLLPALYEKCADNGISSSRLEYMKTMIENMDHQIGTTE